MNSKGILLTAIGCLGAIVVVGQTPALPPPTPGATNQGPGVQAPQDARYADWVKQCKVPPPQRGAGGAARGDGAGRGGDARGGDARGANAAAGPPAPREYTIEAIPGVIAAGQKWKSVWTGTGNNADGIIATKDGGILAAQNTNSDVMMLDKNNQPSFPYKDTNTGGAVSMNKKGALFVVSRGLPTSVWQLAPKRQLLTNMYNGEPLDCAGGGTINDLTADSKGGVYFTFGGLYYANPKGVVTKYGTLTGVNGIILSPDEKTLYVTGRVGGGARAGAAAAPAAPAQGGRGAGGGPPPGGLVAFDVQPDGSLTNERQFAMWDMGGGDGSTVDATGRIYVTTNGPQGLQVISPDGKIIGSIPTPVNFITVAFSGPDKKTLYGVANNQRFDEIFTIQMIAQGYKGRAK